MPTNTTTSPPTSGTRVLVADDSAFMRQTLGQLVGTDPALELVDTVASGADLVSAAARTGAEVIVLNPRLCPGGVHPLIDQLRQECAALPRVLLCVSATSPASHDALQGLTDGAAEIFCADRATLCEHLSEVRTNLVRAIHAAAAGRSVRLNSTRPLPHPPIESRIDIITIAASTGGPPVLERLLTQLPPHLPCPMVIAQSLPPSCIKALAERLDSLCAIAVHHAEQGMPLHAGGAYLIPGGTHARLRAIARGPIRLELGAPHGESAASELFRSAAAHSATHALGIVLSGSSPLPAAADLLNAGGTLLAQDPATAACPTLPAAAVAVGAVPLTPDQIAASCAALAAAATLRAA